MERKGVDPDCSMETKTERSWITLVCLSSRHDGSSESSTGKEESWDLQGLRLGCQDCKLAPDLGEVGHEAGINITSSRKDVAHMS